MTDELNRHLQHRSRLFAALTTGLAIFVAAGITVAVASAVLAPRHLLAEVLVAKLVYWSPGVFYLWALIAIRRTFVDVAAGALFGPAVTRALKHLAIALVLGGILNALVVPLLDTGTLPRPLPDGTRQLFPGRSLELAYVMLAFVGLATLLLSQLVGVAQQYRKQKETLESELQEFL